MQRVSRTSMVIGALLLVGLAGAGVMLAQRRTHRKTAVTETGDVPRRLEAHVRMLAETLLPRDHTHPENLDRVAAYIASEVKKAGGRTSEQPFRVEGRTYRNVIATYGPDTAERLVVGAHYDAAGPYPAADDNASGVAGLIELAYRLKDAKLPLRVDLVAYTLEEPPFFDTEHMGSAVHAASLKKKSTPLRAMVSLEMIGYFTDAPNSQEYPDPSLKAAYPGEGNFIAVVGRTREKALLQRVETAMQKASALPVHSLAGPPSLPGIALSDHRCYWDAGYPAIMVTDTSYYRNRNYHTTDDTPDTLDYERMAMVVEGVYRAVLALGETPVSPAR